MTTRAWRRGTAVSHAGHGDLELAYERTGAGAPLVLIMGIGAQRVFWADDWCHVLAARGFEVVRFDHRDLGESTRLTGAAAPDPAASLRQRMLGRPVAAPHTLSDLARDVVAIADDAGWDRFHVMGVSMGGMIGQTLAIEQPTRIASLTSIMSTPGDRRFLPELGAMRALLQPAPQSVEQAEDGAVRLFTSIGSPCYPLNVPRVRAMARTAWERGPSPDGFRRHFAAIMASGSRRTALRHLTVPTLVIHGTVDPLIPLAAGRATADLVPGARWLPIAGMGHDLPDAIWPVLIDAVSAHARRADPSMR